jgi:hypothetical protein
MVIIGVGDRIHFVGRKRIVDRIGAVVASLHGPLHEVDGIQFLPIFNIT